MANITAAIDNLLEKISDFSDDTILLDNALQPCITEEYALRQLFATDRGNPIIQDPYIGLLDVFDISHDARRARPRLWDDLEQNFVWTHGDDTHTFPQKFILPIKADLRRPRGEPCTVDSLTSFREAWNVFSDGILSAISDWSNIIVAGGSVLACLSSFSSRPTHKERYRIYQSATYKKSDIDLFMWGLTEQEAKDRMEQIFDAINSSLPWEAVCFRKKNTITIQAEFPKRPLQIIMRLYQSPAEILAGFDVDCCCFAYDGTRVFTNPRGLTALVRQCNTIDLSRRSPSCEHRLDKYSTRGFEIFYPALDRSRINYTILSDPERSAFPRGLGRLIVYEIMKCNYKYFSNLYSDLDRIVRPAPIPVERLRPSSYEYAWVNIPYGDKWWNPVKVKERVERVGRQIIDAISEKLGRNVHYHAVTCGTMSQCLSNCCTDWPLHAIDETGENQTEDVHPALFTGPALFIEDDPGRQFIGSFNPSNHGDWEAEAYLVEYEE